MNEVTRILSAIDQGDPHAAEKLLPLVYQELRKLAEQKLAHERPGQTLQATALVHEAYLRLVGADAERHWDSRRHFFAAAARAMRHILVDRARRKRRTKRDGGRHRVELDETLPAPPAADDDLVALDEALTRLAEQDSQAADVVQLCYFAGLSVSEAAPGTGHRPGHGVPALDLRPRLAVAGAGGRAARLTAAAHLFARGETPGRRKAPV
jgi:RNA polymerase sigma factor (TIGR02999 family)